MPRSHRHHALAAGLALIALFAPGRADAQCFPTPPNSIVPSHIVLVGSLGAVPESELGAFVVEARDLANNPLPGAVVAIDLSNAPDLTFCTDQLNPNLVVNCAATTVTATADAAGRAFFTLVGRGNSAGAPSSLHPCPLAPQRRPGPRERMPGRLPHRERLRRGRHGRPGGQRSRELPRRLRLRGAARAERLRRRRLPRRGRPVHVADGIRAGDATHLVRVRLPVSRRG